MLKRRNRSTSTNHEMHEENNRKRQAKFLFSPTPDFGDWKSTQEFLNRFDSGAVSPNFAIDFATQAAPENSFERRSTDLFVDEQIVLQTTVASTVEGDSDDQSITETFTPKCF